MEKFKSVGKTPKLVDFEHLNFYDFENMKPFEAYPSMQSAAPTLPCEKV